jgi:hypothetical protein
MSEPPQPPRPLSIEVPASQSLRPPHRLAAMSPSSSSAAAAAAAAAACAPSPTASNRPPLTPMLVRQLSVSSSSSNRTPAFGAATPTLFASPSFRPRNVEAVEDDLLALDEDETDGAAGNVDHGHSTAGIEQQHSQHDEQQQQQQQHASHHKAHVPLASIEEWYGAAPALYLFGIHTPLRRACIRVAESRALRWLVLACIMVRVRVDSVPTLIRGKQAFLHFVSSMNL